MQGRILRIGRTAGRIAKKPLTWASVIGLTGMSVASIALATAPAQATPLQGSTSNCLYSNAATPANNAAVGGVTPGSQVTISCAAGSFKAGTLLAIVEASGLAAVVSPSSAELNEVDLGTLKLAGPAADGSLNTTINIPAAYAAGDPAAQCPTPQDQVNAGLTCEIVVASLNLATLATTPLDEAQLDYVGQGMPNAPTFHATFKTTPRSKIISVSDVPGACPTPVTADSHCWWGAGVTGAPGNSLASVPGLQTMVSKVHVASNTLQVSPAVYCTTGAVATQCAGLPVGTLVPPQLSGTITTSTGLQPIVIDEPNATAYPGNGTMASLLDGTTNVEAHQTGDLISTN